MPLRLPASPATTRRCKPECPGPIDWYQKDKSACRDFPAASKDSVPQPMSRQGRRAESAASIRPAAEMFAVVSLVRVSIVAGWLVLQHTFDDRHQLVAGR